MNIRNSIKGIIVKNNKILFTKNVNESGEEYYILPGGGQNHGETMVEALKRECLEEISSRVEVGTLVYMRDYIGKNYEFHKDEAKVHQIEYMFACRLCEGEAPVNGFYPDDPGQIGIEWISLNELDKYSIYPKVLKSCLVKGEEYEIYLGDVN